MTEQTVTRAGHDGLCSRNERITQLFDTWGEYIRSLLRKRSSVPPSDIEDLAQEVFLRLLRYSDETAIEHPGGYLCRITTNVANEFCDKARVRQPHDDTGLADLPSESIDEPELALTRAQRDQYIQEAVEKLPPRRREVLLSHLEQGLTYKEIAQQRGLTKRIVVRDLYCAYRLLRQELKREDL
jgi:RNA polymerase sigma-70 factor (ECF subfamily)